MKITGGLPLVDFACGIFKPLKDAQSTLKTEGGKTQNPDFTVPLAADFSGQQTSSDPTQNRLTVFTRRARPSQEVEPYENNYFAGPQLAKALPLRRKDPSSDFDDEPKSVRVILF
jgi:hypothetical protein